MLVEQARQLSSGTISYLIDCRLYVVIDAVRVAFIEYCQTSAADNWKQAWRNFYGEN